MNLPSWIKRHDGVALADGNGPICDLAEIKNGMADLSVRLSGLDRGQPIGLVGDNSVDWIITDLALLADQRISVPIPGFFAAEQVTHLVRSAGIEYVIHNACVLPVAAVFPYLSDMQRPANRSALPPGTAKITFTSGTTGNPKGICLTGEQQLATARGLAEVLADLDIKRHLNLLPLAVLLENIGGVYVPLMLGAQCFCPSLKEVGLSGSSQFDVEKCIATIQQTQAESVILLPQMLQALVAAAHPGDRRLSSLRFIAVGGGTTSLTTLARAAELGLPVFEGYGLSECASVVSLNRPGAQRHGTVGRAIPGVKLRLADDNEIEVSGRGYAGILGEPPLAELAWIKTGDLGEFDADGFLRIKGRKKNVLITSFGRNVSPEWPEALLLDSSLVAQAIVLGDGEASLNAIVVPGSPKTSREEIDALIGQINRQLPDYARIASWHLSLTRFSVENGLATANGRLRRDAIARHFSNPDAIPTGEMHVF